jgi:hypothetical protein
MTSRDWRKIHALTEQVRLAAEVSLAQWQRREAEVTSALSRLDGTAAPELLEDDVVRRAGADLRWQAWCDARRTTLLAELARIRYRKAAAEEELRHAARRGIATQAVLRAEERIEARLNANRAEREGRS